MFTKQGVALMWRNWWRKVSRRQSSPSTSGKGSARRCRLPLNLEVLEDRTVPTTVNWINAAGGTLNTPANWSTGNVPGPNDDAVISTAAAATISLTGGTITVHSLTTAANDMLSLTGGALILAGNSSFSGAVTLANGGLILVE